MKLEVDVTTTKNTTVIFECACNHIINAELKNTVGYTLHSANIVCEICGRIHIFEFKHKIVY